MLCALYTLFDLDPVGIEFTIFVPITLACINAALAILHPPVSATTPRAYILSNISSLLCSVDPFFKT